MNSTAPELVAAIVADVADGGSQRAVAQRHGVSPWTVWRYAAMAGVNRPKPGRGRRQASCRSCGATCWSIRRLCRQCWQRPTPLEPDDADALTGGRWVPNGRGVVVWQSDLEETA